MFTSNGAAGFKPSFPALPAKGMTTISGKRIGNLTLDLVTVEQHESTMRITDNPIESGGVIADHAVLEPKPLRITGIVVDYEPHDVSSTSSAGFNLRGGASFLDNLIPSKFKVITDYTKSRIARELTSYVASSNTVAARTLAPWLPDFAASNAVDNSTSGDRMQRILADFEKLQKSAEPIEIQTGMKLYSNMLIELIGVNQTEEGAVEFNISAREAHIVDTKVIGGVQVSGSGGGDKSGRAGKQGADKSQKGTTQPKEERDQSILGGIFK